MGWEQPLKALAYLVVLVYCWLIRADHPAPARMRAAWSWMAVSANLSIVRHTFEAVGEWQRWTPTVMSWRQVVILLSLVSMTWGLVEMRRSFRAVGLGVRLKRVDWVWLALIVALALPVVLNREGLQDAGSEILLLRYVQFLSSILLAVPAALALSLHRISVEMTGGKWAVALRWLVAFLVVRLVSLCLSTGMPEWANVARWMHYAAPWMFVMAAAERWNVTRAAERMSEQIFVGANKAS